MRMNHYLLIQFTQNRFKVLTIVFQSEFFLWVPRLGATIFFRIILYYKS